MRISPIVMRLRAAIDDFAIAGAAELDVAIANTLKKDVMFVVPISETAPESQMDSGTNQVIRERFAIVTAVNTDYSDKNKTGVVAYDRIHDIRSQLFRAILSWQIVGAESLIEYRGGSLWGVNNAYLWYQFDFEITSRLRDYDGFADIEDADNSLEGEFRENIQRSQLPDFDTIYSKYILWPSANLPWGDDDMPDSSLVDMETIVDFTSNPDKDGGFGRGFSNGFDIYKILNRS